MHFAQGSQTCHMSDVHVTPNTPGFSWREPARITACVNFPDDAVDPTEAQGFIDGLLVSQATLIGIFLVEADLQLSDGGMVDFQPAAEFNRGGKMKDFYGREDSTRMSVSVALGVRSLFRRELVELELGVFLREIAHRPLVWKEHDGVVELIGPETDSAGDNVL